ncbi:amidohydrolase family protein [Adhaeribacter soli]|uniref:Amidohydrolase family protein n=1 Tax=Adhaeribacter soli TaxID=2607655 RepID=A0A5N1IZA4_9BACT|nr:hypothetical protein [Adhaeribacter soli]KAA9338786.1 hypothetical protein F0P94_08275 [Adhaeribacter soli]
MEQEQVKALPIINCHTHIFTGDHVPPYLAKTFLPWPLYYLASVSTVIRVFRFWYNGPYTWQFKIWYRAMKKFLYWAKMTLSRNNILRVISFFLGLFLTIYVFYILFEWLSKLQQPDETIEGRMLKIKNKLESYGILNIPEALFSKLLLIILLIVFFKPGRNLIWFVFKKVWSFLGVLPGPKSKELAKRYLHIGRFAFYKQQARIFGQLTNQYPKGTGFIVLPMDMEYMDAGKLGRSFSYLQQMEGLAAIKQKENYRANFFPFVFAEPRRIAAEGNEHFKYQIQEGKIILQDCFIKKYIEDYHFNGFKIYPALGYYPFDEELLPLWKYAADNALPILTHCIRGTIYYRGVKKKEWDKHPVFEQPCGKGKYEPMLLMETKNSDFCNNFTHPLNYLCLLEEQLLRKVVKKAKSQQIRDLFGYVDADTPLKYDLRHLKLCFGHFGGDDEWNRFLELDRDNFANQLVRNPSNGITFLTSKGGQLTPGKLEQIWRYADWYSIICSQMLQYPNVYADVSYIIHNPRIQPLLNQTLLNDNLKNKVLFGTDFYVVRNRKSEKNILADIGIDITENDFDQIAKANPRSFLYNKLHGAVSI